MHCICPFSPLNLSCSDDDLYQPDYPSSPNPKAQEREVASSSEPVHDSPKKSLSTSSLFSRMNAMRTMTQNSTEYPFSRQKDHINSKEDASMSTDINPFESKTLEQSKQQNNDSDLALASVFTPLSVWRSIVHRSSLQRREDTNSTIYSNIVVILFPFPLFCPSPKSYSLLLSQSLFCSSHSIHLIDILILFLFPLFPLCGTPSKTIFPPLNHAAIAPPRYTAHHPPTSVVSE